MADEFQLGSGNWWDTARTTPPSISTTLNSMASFGGGAMVLHGGDDQSSGRGNGGVLANPNLQMMGLGLSSQGNMDTWNQTLLGEKGESTFRPSNFQHKLYSNTSPDHQDSTSTNRGFSLDHPQFSSQASSNDSTITSQNLTAAGFQLDSTSAAAAYCGYILPENNQHMNNYSYPPSGYGASSAELIPSWNNKYPQFLKTSPPKHLNTTPSGSSSSHLHFTNNTPFWNASSPGPAMADARSSFFPTHNIPAFDEKPKNTLSEITSTKKNSTEINTSNKRPRNETPSPLPAFKVRKEKMGDRITALQQLVSPFGKTDTASVLSEAIDYIKFLHEQVNALSIPYMKNGAPIQYQQNNCDKSNDPEGPRQDLRSRGLCLVPVSSTFPMTHETAVDFWTPTFGGTFR